VGGQGRGVVCGRGNRGRVWPPRRACCADVCVATRRCRAKGCTLEFSICQRLTSHCLELLELVVHAGIQGRMLSCNHGPRCHASDAGRPLHLLHGHAAITQHQISAGQSGAQHQTNKEEMKGRESNAVAQNRGAAMNENFKARRRGRRHTVGRTPSFCPRCWHVQPVCGRHKSASLRCSW